MAKGRKTGGGSRLGRRNKATSARLEKERESGLMPLDYMLQVLRDEASNPEDRRWASKEAAPYMHAKLSSTEIKVPEKIVHEIRVTMRKA